MCFCVAVGACACACVCVRAYVHTCVRACVRVATSNTRSFQSEIIIYSYNACVRSCVRACVRVCMLLLLINFVSPSLELRDYTSQISSIGKQLTYPSVVTTTLSGW